MDKRIPTPWLYDATGSRLFETVTRTPEYYLSRLEEQLLIRVMPQLSAQVGHAEIVELGSGASNKTLVLLEALGARERRLIYKPVDVSLSALQRSKRSLERAFPRLRFEGIEGTYDQALPSLGPVEQRLVVFLGGTLGNLEPSEQEELVAAVGRVLAPGQLLLLGYDRRPHRRKAVTSIRAAYDDAAGAMAQLNRHALVRLVREFGAVCRPATWRHLARYDQDNHRIELTLESPVDADVEIPGLGLTVPFQQGERVRTAISRKFDPDELEAWFEARGFRLRASWKDDRDWVALTLLEKR